MQWTSYPSRVSARLPPIIVFLLVLDGCSYGFVGSSSDSERCGASDKCDSGWICDVALQTCVQLCEKDQDCTTVNHVCRNNGLCVYAIAPVAPQIAALTAAPSSVVTGVTTSVTWSWTYANSPTPTPTCVIDNNVGTLTPGTGTPVTIHTATTYTLTCTNTAGSHTAQTTINVVAAPVPPQIAAFTATPSSVTTGVTTSVTWSWTYANSPTPTPTCAIDNTVGTLTPGVGTPVTINAATTYTLTCTNTAGSHTAQTTVNVVAALVPPQISAFTATPSNVTSGVSTSITWTWSYASAPNPTAACSIDPDIGSMTSGGSRNVTLTNPKIYTLTCTNSAGSSTKIVSIATELASVLTPVAERVLYRKLEIGMALPELGSRIATFLGDSTGVYKPGTANYHAQRASGTILNPYDPDHIDIIADFMSPGGQMTRRYGFYYVPYLVQENVRPACGTYPVNDPPPQFTNPKTLDWVQMPTDYEWRIRFAPNQVGEWSSVITVQVGGVLLKQGQVTFSVTTSNDPGFIKVADNRKYFVYADNPNELFYPMGTNFIPHRGIGEYGCPKANQTEQPHGHTRVFPYVSEQFQRHFDYLTDTQEEGTGQGGNLTRLFLASGGLGVERERLNNYSTRQIEMGEMDNYVDLLEEKGIYAILGLEYNSDYDPNAVPINPDDPLYDGCWDRSQNWPWNPYNNAVPHETYPGQTPSDLKSNWQLKGVEGVTDSRQFFTDANAKQIYKKKLRYIHSRFGYSPHIFLYEMMTELDMLANTHVSGQEPLQSYWTTPGWVAATFNEDVANWANEMAGYLKGLGSKQLTTASYGYYGVCRNDNWMGLNLPPAPSVFSTMNLRLIWTKPNIDVISAHIYGNREATVRLASEEVQRCQDATISPVIPTKPVMVNEYTLGDVVPAAFTCVDVNWHNRNWGMPFSGVAGATYWGYERYALGHYWNYCSEPKDPGYSDSSDPYHGNFERNLDGLSTFMAQVPFADSALSGHTFKTTFSHASGATSEPFGPHEVLYSILPNHACKPVAGWVHNRSFIVQNYQGACYNKLRQTDNEPTSPLYNNMQEIMTAFPKIKDDAPQRFNNGDESGYLTYFPGADNFAEMALAGGYRFYLANGALSLSYDNYRVQWYWTWGADTGTYNAEWNFSPYNQLNWDSALSATYVTIPPTGRESSTTNRPGDLTFIVLRNIAGCDD